MNVRSSSSWETKHMHLTSYGYPTQLETLKIGAEWCFLSTIVFQIRQGVRWCRWLPFTCPKPWDFGRRKLPSLKLTESISKDGIPKMKRSPSFCTNLKVPTPAVSFTTCRCQVIPSGWCHYPKGHVFHHPKKVTKKNCQAGVDTCSNVCPKTSRKFQLEKNIILCLLFFRANCSFLAVYVNK